MKYIQIPNLFLISLIFLASCSKSSDESFNEASTLNGKTETNIQYGSSITQNNKRLKLKMDIFAPESSSNEFRPLVILAHGGGFATGQKEDMSDLAQYLSKHGIVAASINYRLIDVEESAEVAKRAVFDAVHDMKAAIRYFRKDISGNNSYKIDTDNIYVGGYSAGAFMGLHTAYLNSEEELKELGGQEMIQYSNGNGGLEGNSGNPEYSSKIKGCISIAGALYKASFINKNEPILFSFHGTNDQIVPYISGNANETGIITEGPGLYHNIAEQKGITNKLVTDKNGEHSGFWDSENGYSEIKDFILDNK